MDRERKIKDKWKLVAQKLNERERRRWAATEARTAGAGAISLVARATGLSRVTIHRGLQELEELDLMPAGRSRRSGAGPKRRREKLPMLVPALQKLVEPTTRGDPMNPLRWTVKSTRVLATELVGMGFEVSHATVGTLLREMGYSLQGARKTREGTNHPDRNAQFQRLNELVIDFQGRHQPVISVDTKKKELVGDFANRGREWQPKGKPVEVRVHDFVDDKLGKAIPYGVYDVTNNDGLVSVGVTHDTAEFAVATIRRWWQELGQRLYPQATELLITADNGGSNSSRTRLWKLELQRLADDLRLKVRVAHLPPGTSKWNKIEHRMFSRITHNWRGTPLTSLDVIVGLIGATKTTTGLKIKAVLDEAHYEKGRAIPDSVMRGLALVPDQFHGDWNYSLHPRQTA
jgi:transposase